MENFGECDIRRRTKFTPDDDKRLKKLVRKYGVRDWKNISDLMGNKNPRQCRERFSNYLRPELVTKDWTPEEELELNERVAMFGRKWTLLTKFFPNRSDVSIKNQYSKILTRRQKYLQQQIQLNHLPQYFGFNQPTTHIKPPPPPPPARKNPAKPLPDPKTIEEPMKEISFESIWEDSNAFLLEDLFLF